MSSLKYGFVTFPTVAEKEAAIMKFTGYELNDKKMKVEEIHDYKYRVKVPEKLVVYAVGEVKRTREGQKNTMRKVTNSREGDGSNGGGCIKKNHKSNRIKSSYSWKQKNNQARRNRKKKLQLSSNSSSSPSSMLDSRVTTGYKNKKRREKRKNRRRDNHKWDNYGMI